VATIHDVSVARGFSVFRQAYKRRLYPWAIRHARAIVAISEFAKAEARTHLDADPARIRVIHSGPGLPAAAAEASTPNTAEPYFLFVGNLTASKNLPFLIDSFGAAEVDARLVLVGRPGERFSDIREAIARSSRQDLIEMRHEVQDDELDLLYTQALALLLPSRYEGFALTPLEAMARGCPVLASDIPAVREISEGGAWLLPVDNAEAWTDAMRRVVAYPELRASLRERGAQTAAGYSWHETARQLCAVFRDVLGDRR
jgi:glycosyltransferase involved in cell wall biosynthesis